MSQPRQGQPPPCSSLPPFSSPQNSSLLLDILLFSLQDLNDPLFLSLLLYGLEPA